MKILLANPPGPWLRCRFDIKVYKTWMKYYPFPVRLAYATSVLKKNGYEAYIIDATASEMDRKQFIKCFKEIMPDLLIWETTPSSFEYDIKTMKILRKINSKLLVIASGYHATPTYKECLKAGYDFVIVGECEYSILDLVRYLNKETKKFPKGVAVKGHKFFPREIIKNIDELPWPERDSLPMEKYNDPKLSGFNVVLVSSRGCPYQCSFCTVNIYYGKRNYRIRNPKKVVDEMEFLWKKYKPDELYFDDDNFTVNEQHVFGICKEIINRGLKLRWNCMSDAKISKKLLRIMKESGCTGITIGAESADDNVLKYLSKGVRQKDIIEFVENCRKLKIRTHLCWVLGLPNSTKESDMKTIEFAINIPSDTLQFSICVPHPGTEMYNFCIKNGYLEKSWKHFNNEEAVANLPGYNHNEIQNMLKLAIKKWHRKMLIKRPDIIMFHLFNIYKYQGLKGTFKVAIENLKNLT